MPWVDGKRGAYRVRWREGGRDCPLLGSNVFGDLSDANAFLRTKEEELSDRARSRRGARSDDPITTLIKRYRDARSSEGVAREAYLNESSGYILAMAEEMEWTRVRQISAADLVAWRSKRKEGKGTDKPMACVKAFLGWCSSVGIDVDPYALRIKPRVRKKRQSPPLLTKDQAVAILTRAASKGPHYGTILEHLLLFGCRPIDTCKVTIGDWDPLTLTIHYRDTKNKEDHDHIVQPAHGLKLAVLAQGRGAEEFLFLHQGKAWDVKDGRATQLTSWYKANIGKPLQVAGVLMKSQQGIYCLKDYGMGTLSRASGGDRASVVAISGHKTLSVVDRYMTTNAETQARLVLAISSPLKVIEEDEPPILSPNDA